MLPTLVENDSIQNSTLWNDILNCVELNRAIRGWGYAFKQRGEMEVKGKGVMNTHFLCGHLSRRLKEPQDDFTKLEIIQDGSENGDFLSWPRTISQDFLDKAANMEDDESYHYSLKSSEAVGESEEVPHFYSSLDKDLSQENPHIRRDSHQNFDNLSQNSKDLLKDDSPKNLTSSDSQNRLGRRKKTSKSSKTAFYDLQNNEPEAVEVSSNAPSTQHIDTASKDRIEKSFMNTQVIDQCLYINGSFKNEFRTRNSNSVENKDSEDQSCFTDKNIQEEPQTPTVNNNCSDTESGQNISYEETRTPSQNSNSNYQKGNSPSVVKITKGRKSKSLTFYHSKPTITLDCIHSIPKSETFTAPVIRTSVQQGRQSSTSLDILDVASKNKRGKKQHSKLCNVI